MTADSTVSVEDAVRLLIEGGASLLRTGTDSSAIRDLVLHVPGDPEPGTGLAVLWAGVDGPAPPGPVVVVREATTADALPLLSPACTVLTVPGGERWTELHARLRSRVFATAEPPDLFAMADALALAVGGAVAIEDVERRLLAFSTIEGQPIDEVRRSGILGRRVPEHVERDGWYRLLWRSSEPLHFDAGPESSPRLALALRSAGERVGSVWVVGDRSSLHPDSEQTLMAGATGLAAAVVAATGTGERSREQRSRMLARVLAETRPADLDDVLPAVVVGIAGAAGGVLDDLVRARLADVLSLQASRRDGSGLAGEVSGVVLAVLEPKAEERVESLLRAVLERNGVREAAVAVSDPVLPGRTMHEAHAQVLSLLTLPQDDVLGVRFASRSRALVQLARVGEALLARDALPDAGASVLTASDAENGTRYAESLLAWLDANGDVTRAAARLHVHANTLRYRWNRAVQLFGLDLEDADARLLLHLELRLRTLGHTADE